jgi:hypothetical protein
LTAAQYCALKASLKKQALSIHSVDQVGVKHDQALELEW